jgi:uncharacterized protein
MKLTKEIILQKIKENKHKIKEFGVEEISLFGSYAKDKQKWGSDVDLLVEYGGKRGRTADDHFGLIYYLEKLLRRNVDLGEKRNLKEGYRENILKGGLLKC